MPTRPTDHLAFQLLAVRPLVDDHRRAGVEPAEVVLARLEDPPGELQLERSAPVLVGRAHGIATLPPALEKATWPLML
jgi:hypothetical protein